MTRSTMPCRTEGCSANSNTQAPAGFRLEGSEVSPLKVQFRAQTQTNEGDTSMGTGDKASNKIDDLGGKAKEGLGKAPAIRTPRTKARSTKQRQA